ncbi:unnamed protein product [Dibothriocephalus latus]|uniref:Reverse transcriptase domain-containing protein n=1 Tax=Dibothriocephalus latus TaxID=60516 RepID=A0A3P7MEL2_DIBLA|nr:unnamed protein product [Dibothriocephalus latus]
MKRFAVALKNTDPPLQPYSLSHVVNNLIINTVLFTQQEVLVELKLDPAKSPGLDEILGVLLRELSEELAEPLCTIFRKSLEAGKLPETWKLAKFVPIHKERSRLYSTTYRPVS